MPYTNNVVFCFLCHAYYTNNVVFCVMCVVLTMLSSFFLCHVCCNNDAVFCAMYVVLPMLSSAFYAMCVVLAMVFFFSVPCMLC